MLMNWEQYSAIMDRYAIKTDDMATEDAYFMATHMPFSALELFRGGYYDKGNMPAPSALLSEDEVFEQLIYNPDNRHRMIIVRGEHGTGKSHLIRYLKGKFERSPSTIYKPSCEQLIFLRRLNNSVRGAFSQLLEQDAVKDSDTEEKLRRFVASSDSKDEEAFKTEILFAFVTAVRNDTTNEVYKEVICRNIASYLSDSRVCEHLLREGGAISRCYNVITAPGSQILQDTTTFTEEDFNVSKIIRAVMKQGDPKACLFATTIKGDEDEIAKLVNYLNGFTRDVVQHCADISSEKAETIFAELRRDLKKQGKNLTIFIEDFTGFTGIDQELITALSYEHGGDYEDMCRVTSVIGITNDYYFAFRGNFKDRVTHQIVVTDRSYGTDEFLVQMTGRYLNAIYSDPEAVRSWNEAGADLSELPVSDFTPPCDWEKTTVGEKEVTLYPFNRKALRTLYEALSIKSPRMFLKNVIREQLRNYFDGKEYGDGWRFPVNVGNIQMTNASQSSSIDRYDAVSAEDRFRLKSVFAIWGDGTATGVKDEAGEVLFGGVKQSFLQDIALGAFKGIGGISDVTTGEMVSSVTSVTAEGSAGASVSSDISKPRQVVDSKTKNYYRYNDDINSWFTNNTPLKFDDDYRKWLRVFIKGTDHPNSAQPGAVNWQDIGVPAYIAQSRLYDLSCYYIEDQSVAANADKAMVHMDRSTESRDALIALNEFNYAGSWEFEGAVYFQQRLITWLERRKKEITDKVTAADTDGNKPPVLEWCLAIQYLKARILGQNLDTSSPVEALRSLFRDFKKDDSIKRDTREWNDLIQFVLNRRADFDLAWSFLKKSSATTMGAVHFSDDVNSNNCYRADELIKATEKLMAVDWDIESELPDNIPPNHMLYNPASLLRSLYTGIRKAMSAETKEVATVTGKLKGYIGELTEKNLTVALSSVQELFSVFAVNGILGNTDLSVKYEKPPVETAKVIAEHVKLLEDAADTSFINQLGVYSANSLNALCVFLRDIQAIALKAEQEEAKANREIANIGALAGTEDASKAALEYMEELYDRLESMEVYEDAVD